MAMIKHLYALTVQTEILCSFYNLKQYIIKSMQATEIFSVACIDEFNLFNSFWDLGHTRVQRT